ncbi:MAG: hypothetical protein CK430_09945 [Legionella sp.]|nr:MAG: hypothetical protein CK430_09945 [Legionella sp.]
MRVALSRSLGAKGSSSVSGQALRDVAGAPPQAERFSKTLDLTRNIIQKKVTIPQDLSPTFPMIRAILKNLVGLR